MEREVLRFARVTYEQKGGVYLRDFDMSILRGEIMGLLPLNAYGLPSFLSLLKYNHPLYFGRVYYMGKLVNSWQDMKRVPNRVTVIGSESSLVAGQSVLTNIFVLRAGFGQYLIRKKMLESQLKPFLEDIDAGIRPDMRAEALSAFERVAVEILRAVVAGHRLIVLKEVGAFIGEDEKSRLYRIIRHYRDQGFSFLFISGQLDEIKAICERVSIMSNGKILNILDTKMINDKTGELLFYGYTDHIAGRLKEHKKTGAGRSVLELRDLSSGILRDISLTIREGEYLVIRPLENRVFEGLVSLVFGETKAEKGGFFMEGHEVFLPKTRRVVLLKEKAEDTMLFPDMSYMDNLLFTIDHKIPSVWLRKGVSKSVRQELSGKVGADVFSKSIRNMTRKEKIELVYARIMLQKPDAVFCVMPFKEEDISMRLLIWELQELLLKRNIAVVTITMNLSDSISLADRLVQISADSGMEEYIREEYGPLSENVSWRDIFRKKDKRPAEKKGDNNGKILH